MIAGLDMPTLAFGQSIRTGLLPDERISAHYWSTHEDRIIREVYPAGGPQACLRALPMRTYKAIRHRAYTLGVKGPGRAPSGPAAGTKAGMAWAIAWRERNRPGFDAMDAAGLFALEAARR